MANRIEGFDVSFPAGTQVATPVTINTPFPDGTVVRVDVQVPPGPSGLVGWAILHSQQQIIPRKTGQYIVADDSDFSWALEDYPVGSLWAFRGYNTDIYVHTIHVQFLINELATPETPPPVLVPIVADQFT